MKESFPSGAGAKTPLMQDRIKVALMNFILLYGLEPLCVFYDRHEKLKLRVDRKLTAVLTT